MRIYSVVSATLGGVLLMGVSTSALAGCGGNYGNVNCDTRFNPGVVNYEGVRNVTCRTRPVGNVLPAGGCVAPSVVQANTPDPLAPVNTYNHNPYGYLKTFTYKNTPDVNVMRVYARAPQVGLSDVPTGFSGGCTPTPTRYCRGGRALTVTMPQTAPRPMFSIAPRPVMRPIPVAPVRVRTGGGFNASNFASRVYGENKFTPGIAHIPTSIVDRSPITHIDGVPQKQIRSVTTVNGTYGVGQRSTMTNYQGGSRVYGGNLLGHVSGGSYTYTKPGSPDYWEKTSGATIVNGLPATQILCRRQGTGATTQTVNVVRPVIGVPQPVPTPVAVGVSSCQQPPAPMAMGNRPFPGSRWTY